MERNVEICPHCGRKMVTYKHKLNRVLLNDLFKLRACGGSGRGDELGLTNSQFANMQKLKYFGLIDKDKRVYILNDLGIAFLEGEAKVPRAVYTRFNEVVDQEDPIYIYQVENYAQAKEEWEEQASLYN